MSPFDALQPDADASFDRAAAHLRTSQPRPRGRRRVLALAALLAAAAGACSYPVETDETLGYGVEWTTYGSVGPGNYTVKALDALVPTPERLSVETSRAERPSVPPDHEWPTDATWTRVRYTVGTTRQATAEAWADSMRALVGAYNVRVVPAVRHGRQPLAVAAIGRLGEAVSPADPSVSDQDLQALLDEQVERLGTGPGSPYHRSRPRIERILDGRRILRFEDSGHAILLADGVRIWVRPDAHPSQQINYEGVTSDEILHLTDRGWRPLSDLRLFDRPGGEAP